MHINWWTLALQTINVLVLVWLLGRFLYRPVMDAIAARQAAAEKLLADATLARGQAEAERAALKAQNDAFASDTERHRAEMRASVEADRIRLLDEAKQAAAAFAQQAEAANAAERESMTRELEARAVELAGRMAEKLLGRIGQAAATEAMFQALIERVCSLPDNERGELAKSDGLDVVTAAPLTADEQARYAHDLTAALPGLGAPAFKADVSLIAGFELHGPRVLVRNSWRADLDDLLERLREEDDHARLG